MIIDIKTIPFESDGNILFHPESNELEYKFRAVSFVKQTSVFIKINPDTREIEYVQIYAPVICGNAIQYPINIDYESVLKDYDFIIKNFNRDDK